jgi:hypothetical protein
MTALVFRGATPTVFAMWKSLISYLYLIMAAILVTYTEKIKLTANRELCSYFISAPERLVWE